MSRHEDGNPREQDDQDGNPAEQGQQRVGESETIGRDDARKGARDRVFRAGPPHAGQVSSNKILFSVLAPRSHPGDREARRVNDAIAIQCQSDRITDTDAQCIRCSGSRHLFRPRSVLCVAPWMKAAGFS
ncbi:hypothetical protein KQX54_015707 [Cotesia glomerata]|uniref:Uncharacterized protein n=1 Tax=Cotesia glomerata TaxID=32391 RepID=A0AAV7ING0_COTGL|nr:hypothetical protein KQX54_015707 [Cotesia glomerata]